ncbi:MAG: hypothetical protein EPN47_19005 [Acidobacteria bacterium]|nr:MAG: hypothetical protein EPN47_19005 [Acidobacteriota bacterium]
MNKTDWRVIEEKEWYRHYTSSEYPSIYESKFATGEATISLAELQSRWPGWNEGEQVQFAQAFACKPVLMSEDEGILGFLMTQGGEMVSSSIATMVAKLPDRKRAAVFLADRLQSFPKARGNFLLALARLAAPETAPHLLSVYKECSDKVGENAQDYDSITDLLYCSAALYTATKDPKYIDLISSYSHHPDERARYQAENAMRWTIP